ncbi:hypothetical protein SDC9_122638 [bioreactor metagenome]|uniref:Uncharacterized protein n=1 Tax=bioreactor metagenome TaxID=1076179 RepID=A0A645CFE5_9ZZZZ
MAVGGSEHLVASPCLEVEADEVSHAARGDKQSFWLTRQFSGQGLEPCGRGIFPIDIIPDFCTGHYFAHFKSRFGDRVASEVILLHGLSPWHFGKTIPNRTPSVQQKEDPRDKPGDRKG